MESQPVEAEKAAKKDQTEPGKYSSRKFWVSILPLMATLVAASTFLWFGRLSESGWLDITKWSAVVIGIYSGSNVASRALDVLQARLHKPAAE